MTTAQYIFMGIGVIASMLLLLFALFSLVSLLYNLHKMREARRVMAQYYNELYGNVSQTDSQDKR